MLVNSVSLLKYIEVVTAGKRPEREKVKGINEIYVMKIVTCTHQLVTLRFLISRIKWIYISCMRKRKCRKLVEKPYQRIIP